MKDFLVFRLYGPIVSWGNIAVGEYRPSDSFPTKSAIIGLISASFGFDRSEDGKISELVDSVFFATKVLAPGNLLRDYHTIQSPSNVKRVLATRKDELLDSEYVETILSSRDYRTDAVYDIALSEKKRSSHSLKDIRKALLSPIHTPYLGRKSCSIALPMCPEILNSDSLRSAFEEYDKILMKKYESSDYKDPLSDLFSKSSANLFLWEDPEFAEQDHTHSRRDEVLNRKRWQFQDRKEFLKNVPKT
ncbi:type I-E CRISPR-associated protein Cas5/CasD [Leptospira santarosai]|uniref:type I-E CRISPR-associated protein Cas5/CasD n=1 Tax=Leptospira santarosai TaxID=28183 RepID=UPI0002487ED5|nr:type I-E CRISPR-associated protein Cas5/CasD [Leptospira santarosai]EMM76981.1 CRISPR-associated protein Cas5/CasD, subtype TIGR01868 [Leptospira santarosai str. 2000030832]